MSYEGSFINPSVPAKAILYTADGSTVTGDGGFQYTETGQIYNSASENYIQLNDTTMSHNLKVYSDTSIFIESQSETELQVDSLVVNLTKPSASGGGIGETGQYLASDGEGHVIWKTPTSSKPDAYGKATFSTTPITTWVIPITGLTATGLVMVNYVHSGTGGANHYIKEITPGTDQLTVVLSHNFEGGDSIIWNVLKFEHLPEVLQY